MNQKALQIVLIALSMLLFLGCHLIQSFSLSIDQVYFLGFLIITNIFVDICLFLAFFLLFVVIVLILLEKDKIANF